MNRAHEPMVLATRAVLRRVVAAAADAAAVDDARAQRWHGALVDLAAMNALTPPDIERATALTSWDADTLVALVRALTGRWMSPELTAAVCALVERSPHASSPAVLAALQASERPAFLALARAVVERR